MPSEESKLQPVTPEMLLAAANYPAPDWLPDYLDGTFVFAREAHKKQFRKYTGDPYIVHPLDVLHKMLTAIDAVSASSVAHVRLLQLMRPYLQACLLHDVVEDCEVSLSTIEKEFGFEVAEAVYWVTDTLTKAQGNRATRKRLEALRIAHAPLPSRCVKLCDIASNTGSIVENDPHFAVPYIKEKAYLLSIMRKFNESEEERGVIALFHNLMGMAVANTAV